MSLDSVSFMAITKASCNYCRCALCGTRVKTTNGSELEIYMYVCNPWSQLFINQLKVTVRESNPGRDDNFCTCPDWPWSPTRLLQYGYRVSFPGARQLKRSIEHPPVSSVQVKERIALKRYSSPGLSCYSVRVNFTFLLKFQECGGLLLIASSILYPRFSVSSSLRLRHFTVKRKSICISHTYFDCTALINTFAFVGVQ